MSNKRIIEVYDPKTNKVLKEFSSRKEAAKYFDCSEKAIYDICKGKQKTLRGKFVYIRNKEYQNYNSLKEEEWKKIKNFPNYEVSSYGRVRNIKRKVLLRQLKSSKGFLGVHLNSKPFLVHKLVAEAFLENDNPSYNRIGHKDGNRENNRVDNLYFTNQSEIMKKGYDEGKIKKIYGKTNKKKIVIQYKDETFKKIIRIFSSIKEAAKYFDCNENTITKIYKKEQKLFRKKPLFLIIKEVPISKDYYIRNEIWKDIKGSISLQVSNLGRVRNKLNKNILQGSKDASGYLKIAINDKNKFVHRLVAEAFIPNPNNYNTVDHKNNNKYDNRVANLQWLSDKDNLKKAHKDKRFINKNSKIIEYDKDFKILAIYNSTKEASIKTNIYHKFIRRVSNLELPSHKNKYFIFFKPGFKIKCTSIKTGKSKISRKKLKDYIEINNKNKDLILIIKAIKFNSVYRNYKWEYYRRNK